MQPAGAIQRPTDVIRAAVLLLALLAVAGCATASPRTTLSSPPCSSGGPVADAGSGCSTPATTVSPDPIGLGVVNSTDLRLSLVVNSKLIETLSPHTGDVAIHVSALPPLPWVVEVRTTSGRVLATMTAGPGDVQGPAAIGVAHSGKQGGANLSCGQLYLWTGAIEPSWPAPNESGSPGDCGP
jgi:hypothetical protein